MLRSKNKVPPDPKTAQDSALRSLGRREHSAAQLKSKLKFRGYDETTIAQTVDALAEKGWQSDARFAELLVRSRIAGGYGPLRIRAELAVAGVPDAEIAAVLEAADCDWRALAVRTHQRKFGALPDGAAQSAKQYRYLAARGFNSEQIFAALKNNGDSE